MLIFATKAVEWWDHQQRFLKIASLVYFSYAKLRHLYIFAIKIRRTIPHCLCTHTKYLNAREVFSEGFTPAEIRGWKVKNDAYRITLFVRFKGSFCFRIILALLLPSICDCGYYSYDIKPWGNTPVGSLALVGSLLLLFCDDNMIKIAKKPEKKYFVCILYNPSKQGMAGMPWWRFCHSLSKRFTPFYIGDLIWWSPYEIIR